MRVRAGKPVALTTGRQVNAQDELQARGGWRGGGRREDDSEACDGDAFGHDLLMQWCRVTAIKPIAVEHPFFKAYVAHVCAQAESEGRARGCSTDGRATCAAGTRSEPSRSSSNGTSTESTRGTLIDSEITQSGGTHQGGLPAKDCGGAPRAAQRLPSSPPWPP